jgi:cobalt-precorrin 5A hydrolase
VKQTMSVAGFGFRGAATAESLRSALKIALAQSDRSNPLIALATAWDKAAAPAFLQFAAECGLPVLAVSADQLLLQEAQASAQVPARYGHRSLAESAALAGAGSGAHMLVPRCVSADHLATAAIATTIPENTYP